MEAKSDRITNGGKKRVYKCFSIEVQVQMGAMQMRSFTVVIDYIICIY